jgi:2-polyprenyl-6-methoxyphenol hydroxylase-like FAD-dependent oxidoreductase
MLHRNRSHAVVIGGSIAGLCAARALSRHFVRVTLVERDRLSEGPEHRAGVPQSQHVHALLLRGLLELEKLFPGIEEDLQSRGAQRMDLGFDFAHFTDWGWAPRARIDVEPLTMSRILIESVVRARLLRDTPNLTLLQETKVTGLKTESRGSGLAVTGVTTDRAGSSELFADLVVDASGRNSKCLDWLEAQGVCRPPEVLVDAFAGYASRFYELASDNDRWWRGMLIDPKAPDQRRWALLMPVEDGRHVLTLGGLNRDYPPGDEEGFAAFIAGLRSPALARALVGAKPVSPVRTHRALYNRARHFERWAAKVSGFVALGDSAIAFNAYHGQGMSMAALAATTLEETCAHPDRFDAAKLPARFHRRQWLRLRDAWDIAVGMDFEWPETVGTKPRGYAFLFNLSVAVIRAAHDDPELKRRLGPVFQLVASPYTLIRPGIVSRVALSALRRALGGGSLAQSAPAMLKGRARELADR